MTTEEILKLLYAAPAALRAKAICRELSLHRCAVRKAVRELRQAGYEIEGSLRTGLRLLSGDDRLALSKIAACIPCHPWLEKVQIFDSLESTNTLAKQLAAEGAPAGTVILAETQSAGRGRLGRSFSSAPGGLYMSVILRPEGKPEDYLHLTAAAAVAAMRAIEESFGVKADIKWTNDLVVSGRKICGILTELSAGAVIVGVGINCNQTTLAPEIADMASTLAAQLGRPIDRNILAANLIHAFFALSVTLFSHKEHWLRRFTERCITVGQDVKLVQGGEVRFAHAESVGVDGALIVRLPDGSTEAVTCGEVSVRGMYGYAGGSDRPNGRNP